MAKSEAILYHQRFQEALVDTFKNAISLIESHNLRYYCAFGTALGAVRHHGIIPWDDDIDILMPIEDYNKLLQLEHELSIQRYRLISWNNPDYYLPFAKIFDSHTTLWEERRSPSLLGVYIDVHPLCFSSLNNDDYNKQLTEFLKDVEAFNNSKSKYSIAELVYDFKHHLFGAAYYGLKSMFYHSAKANMYKERILNSPFFTSFEGDRMMSFTGVYGIKELYDPSWFSDYELYDFSDFKVRCPIGVDEYLKQIYGSYMSLPPEEKRIPHHGQYYVNLKERLSISQVKERIHEGEYRVY